MWHLECCTYNCIDNIMQANPPQLHSNLLYIQRHRSQSRLVAEAAIFFTNMLSAESFISNIDAKALSMDETEFEVTWKLLEHFCLGYRLILMVNLIKVIIDLEETYLEQNQWNLNINL